MKKRRPRAERLDPDRRTARTAPCRDAARSASCQTPDTKRQPLNAKRDVQPTQPAVAGNEAPRAGTARYACAGRVSLA